MFSLRFLFPDRETLSEHAAPMNPKPHVELDTCGSNFLGKNSGFRNPCVHIPLGQTQRHTFRLTLAL